MKKFTVWAVLFGRTASVFANGFRLPDQDAFATARGEAFVATADNASAIYYNPAGISQLDGGHFRGGIYGIYLPMTYKSPDGRNFDNKKTLQAAPQLFLTYGPEESPFSFGFGLYAPFGLGLHWPQDTGFRTLGYESQLSYLTANPVVAWKILPNLSVAAGLTITMPPLICGLGWFGLINQTTGFASGVTAGMSATISARCGVQMKRFRLACPSAAARAST